MDTNYTSPRFRPDFGDRLRKSWREYLDEASKIKHYPEVHNDRMVLRILMVSTCTPNFIIWDPTLIERVDEARKALCAMRRLVRPQAPMECCHMAPSGLTLCEGVPEGDSPFCSMHNYLLDRLNRDYLEAKEELKTALKEARWILDEFGGEEEAAGVREKMHV